MSRRWVPYALLAPGGVWLAVFFVVPMVTLASTSLQEGSLSDGYALTWRIANYADALALFWPQFLRSFAFAGVATGAALVIAYPLAYAIAFKAGRWRNLLLLAVVAPFFSPFLVRTLSWKVILSDGGWVVAALRSAGILSPNGRVLATSVAVVAGLTYNFLPFMTLPLYASLERVDRRLVEAAQDLYASRWTAFRRVTWPLSLPGVVGGTLLTFIPAAGDPINARLLGTPAQAMIGNVIDSRFLVVLDYPTAAALSFLLMVTMVVLASACVSRADAQRPV